MDARGVVLQAAQVGVRAETPEEGFAQIRSLSGTDFSDVELADAVAAAVRDRLLREPVRLLPQHLKCFWQLELAQTH
jgi:hypothetical protein